MLHHYTEYVDEKVVAEAEYSLLSLIDEYKDIENNASSSQVNNNNNIQLFPAF